MPVITVDMLEGRSAEQKKQLIHELAEAASRILERDKEHFEVVIREVPKENWGHRGEQLQ